jgi:hypothetical protein
MNMNMLKNTGALLMLGMATTGLIMVAAPVRAVDLNPEMLTVVDEMVRKMQQETMQQQYATMPLKNELPSKVMDNMYNSMYQYASNTYRQSIQPQVVPMVISQIRPWELPNKFKQRMMPDIVAQVSGQIKGSQLQQMQEGIADPSFPNVPGLGSQEGAQQVK